ncbi:hypothetical protein CR513_44797, partial [Mucuna pruriens]
MIVMVAAVVVCGGLIKDSFDKWINGFTYKLVAYGVLVAKAWGVGKVFIATSDTPNPHPLPNPT